jgi:coenzyme F420-reducing hydrogenase beta subunit
MQEDREGFLYPEIDKESCVGCDVCEEVCPSVHPKAPRTPLRVYAAKNKDEAIRLQSSSGGIFTLLAEKIIDRNGVVFGARFNEDWEVVHGYVETKEKLSVFRGSKYVQSRIGESYKQAEEFLKAGRFVLFSGTPCQVAGLKLFLKKEYENLVTVDLICHGVPSPGVWRKYLDEFIEYQYNIKKCVCVGGVFCIEERYYLGYLFPQQNMWLERVQFCGSVYLHGGKGDGKSDRTRKKGVDFSYSIQE